MPTPPPSLTLLALNVNEDFCDREFQQALSYLPQEEQEVVFQKKYKKDQLLALASLMLRRYHLTQCLAIPWETIQFYRWPDGKPAVVRTDERWIDFNMSHDGHWVVLCATDTTPLQVGIDLVTVSEPEGESVDHFLWCYRSILTSAEWDLLQTSRNPLRTFYEIWGCKESYTKAVGKGLRFDLTRLSFENDENENVIDMILEDEAMPEWHHHISRLDEKTIAVVCFGSNESRDTNDSFAFAKTTQMLGQEPTTMHPYTIVTWQDILCLRASST